MRPKLAKRDMDEHKREGPLDPKHPDFHRVFGELPIRYFNEADKSLIDGLIKKIPEIIDHVAIYVPHPNRLKFDWAMQSATNRWPEFYVSQKRDLLGLVKYIEAPSIRTEVLTTIGKHLKPETPIDLQDSWAAYVFKLHGDDRVSVLWRSKVENLHENLKRRFHKDVSALSDKLVFKTSVLARLTPAPTEPGRLKGFFSKLLHKS